MNNSSRFFANTECEYFPCHEGLTDFNCLFCYCPLYTYPACPGKYSMKEKDGRLVKSCLECDFPHDPKNYEAVMRIIKHNL